MNFMAFLSAHPFLTLILGAIWSAISIDVFAFVASKAPGDFFRQYSFRIAGWRILQSLVGSLVGNFAVMAGTATTTAVVGLLLWHLAH